MCQNHMNFIGPSEEHRTKAQRRRACWAVLAHGGQQAAHEDRQNAAVGIHVPSGRDAGRHLAAAFTDAPAQQGCVPMLRRAGLWCVGQDPDQIKSAITLLYLFDARVIM